MGNVIFTTKRLIVRFAKISDKQFIFNLLNAPKWLKYIGDRGIKTLKNAEEYIQEKLILNYEKNGFGLYVMEQIETKCPIGICGFVKRDYLDSLEKI